MSFAENLKRIRKAHGFSQEELAEIMEVSRQAVSKWELGGSYPETQKLLLLSKRFNVSLDSLLSGEIAGEKRGESGSVTGSIVITSPHENVVAACYKVMASQKMKGGRKAPQYGLFGVGVGGYSYWGEPTVFLGWYAGEEQLSKEIGEIQRAIARGEPTYTLQYSVKVIRKWLHFSMVEE